MNTSLPDFRPSETRDRLGAGLVVLWVVLLLLGLALVAGAAEEEDETPSYPTGVAKLALQDRVVGAAPFSLAPAGPLFALDPIARALGVELRVGPYGKSHTLFFEGLEITVGPDMAAMVVVSSHGGAAGEEVVRLDQRPFRRLDTLEVPLDFLERAFGEHLDLQFEWLAEELRLQVSRRVLQTLDTGIDVVHQYGSSTVVVRFSDAPRYRVEHLPGALEIRMLGDRLAIGQGGWRGEDPLVRNVVVLPDRLRIQLADGATAVEPRFDGGSSPRLVVEVIRQAAVLGGSDGDPWTPTPFAGRESRRGGIRTIVLDPGHGGEETGAIGRSGKAEKDLTLQVARSLRRALERRLPVRVVLTRETDVDIPLDHRTAIANQNRADLFISLHFNSAYGARAHGAETFFLSREASDQLAAKAAERENRTAAASGNDPELDLQMILWDLAQSHHLAASQRFANLVQQELNVTLGLRDRGVKQAPFRVLMGANMPAVLVELGFLSNPEEEAKLDNPLYQAELVDALVRATQRFKTQMEAREASLGTTSGAPAEGRP